MNAAVFNILNDADHGITKSIEKMLTELPKELRAEAKKFQSTLDDAFIQLFLTTIKKKR